MAAPALPPPLLPRAIEDELSYDPEQQQEIVREFLSVGNAEQLTVYHDTVAAMALLPDDMSNPMCSSLQWSRPLSNLRLS